MPTARSTVIKQKPWGTEEVWATTHHSVGKILTINKGHRLSRKYHKIKTHSIRILSGQLFIEIGPSVSGGEVECITLEEGDAYFVGANIIHRFCAPESTVRLVEVSSRGPRDSVRLEDDYRRVSRIPEPPPSSGK